MTDDVTILIAAKAATAQRLTRALNTLPNISIGIVDSPQKILRRLARENEKTALIFIETVSGKPTAVNRAERIRAENANVSIPLVFIGDARLEEISRFRGFEKGPVDCLPGSLSDRLIRHKTKFYISVCRQKRALKSVRLECRLEADERKKIKEQLKESENQFNSLSLNSPDIIYALDYNGAFTYVNPAWERILGYPLEEVLGKYFVHFADKKDAASYRHMFKQIRDGNKILRDIAGTLVHRNGSQRLFNLSGAPLVNADGEITGMVGLLQDITEQKKLQAQLLHAQKMEAIGILAGGVAHDFNNLLQAVQGYADLILLSLEKTDTGYVELKEIKQAALRGAELTRQLLTFSRKVESKLRPVSIQNEIEKVHSLLIRTIPKMIHIECRMAAREDTVNADPGQIEQVLMNLAVNARDAMPDGGKLVIETRNVTLDETFCAANMGSKPGDYIQMEVADSGVGMEKKVLDHVFEPFFTTKQAGKGTGLGLSIVYGIVKNHGGYITCDSKPGKGTVFRIYMPLMEHLFDVAEEAVEPKDHASLRGKETLLVVDDDDDVRQVGERILKKFGYSLLSASNGEEALRIYRRKHRAIDLVMLDLIMPGMGGKRCLEEMIRINPDAKVILTTGYAFGSESRGKMASLAKGFVDKPYDWAQLLGTLRQVLDT